MSDCVLQTVRKKNTAKSGFRCGIPNQRDHLARRHSTQICRGDFPGAGRSLDNERRLRRGEPFSLRGAAELSIRTSTSVGVPDSHSRCTAYYAAFMLDPHGNNIGAVFRAVEGRSAPDPAVQRIRRLHSMWLAEVFPTDRVDTWIAPTRRNVDCSNSKDVPLSISIK
jgi:hypothetical protein